MSYPAEFDLCDRVILITGAAGQIGSEIADAFVSYGGTVVLTDVLPEETMSSRAEELSGKHDGATVLGLRLDVCSDESVERAVAAVEERLGRLDVLVNNAAIDAKFDARQAALSRSRFEQYPLELWERSVAVNLTGLMRVTQSALRPMLAQRRGNIINVASTYGRVAPNQGLYDFGDPQGQTFKPVDYIATKAALPNLTRYLATLYAGDGIRCNCIAPQGVENGHDAQFRRNFARLSPMGRMCEVSELRGPFVFLASDASSYMTGAVLDIDGGWTAW